VEQIEREKSMRFTIVSILTAAATLATISTAFAQNDQRVPRATTNAPATTKNAEPKDAATGNVPGLITSEHEKAIPYRACINARGWANGRLVCDD
jgi:hypothetical protein